MSAAYQTRFGWTDEEVLERLRSFLRRFSKMTKEMRPSHQIDILTDALLYYAKFAASNLSMLEYIWFCAYVNVLQNTFCLCDMKEPRKL